MRKRGRIDQVCTPDFSAGFGFGIPLVAAAVCSVGASSSSPQFIFVGGFGARRCLWPTYYIDEPKRFETQTSDLSQNKKGGKTTSCFTTVDVLQHIAPTLLANDAARTSDLVGGLPSRHLDPWVGLGGVVAQPASTRHTSASNGTDGASNVYCRWCYSLAPPHCRSCTAR